MGGMSTEADVWSFRAQTAADAVNTRFGHRLLGLPGTWIGAIRYPRSRDLRPWAEWHYWWQAHYLDCLVDRPGGSAPPLRDQSSRRGQLPAPLRRGQALLRTIRIRNFLHLTNSFYDDMAWLALATGRADSLAADGKATGTACSPQGPVRLRSATADSRTRRILAAASSGPGSATSKTPRPPVPSALYFARTGQRDRAQRLVDWLRNTLFDPATGLYLDGIHPNPAGPEIERTIYTYNQGPVLGALLELGGAANLASAAELVEAVSLHLTQAGASGQPRLGPAAQAGASDGGIPVLPEGRLRPLRLEGPGDRGLFTGILVRYLAAAADHPALPEPARATAARLVLNTAEALWRGRNAQPFNCFPERFPASAPPASAVELSTQLQAWMAFETAFRVAQGSPLSRKHRRTRRACRKLIT